MGACLKNEDITLTKHELVQTALVRENTNDNNPVNIGSTHIYGDTIFYLSSNSSNIISPTHNLGEGRYVGFPGGIEIDSMNGDIDLMESETGLRYKIMFIPEGSTDTVVTKIVISGINFYDQIFNLSKGDSIAHSIYNASGIAFVPGQFGVGKNCSFDDGKLCNKQGCVVSYKDGHINLAQSLRNGAIETKNNSQKEFLYQYRMDDKSDKFLNSLKIKLYFYNTENDIPQYLWDIILKERQGTIVPALKSVGLRGKTATPRPPCLIIVMN